MNGHYSHPLAVLLSASLFISISLHAADMVNSTESNFPTRDFISLDIPGLKVGLASDAEDYSGLQLGLLVHADNPCGMQFGLFVAAAEAFQGWQHGTFFAFAGTPCSNMSKLSLGGSLETVCAHGLQTSIICGAVDRLIGVQSSLVGATAWEVRGAQLSILKVEAKTMAGIQMSLWTYADDLSGVQLGIFNETGALHGLQLGVWNRAHGGSGLQLGLVNGFDHDKGVRWMPLVNARF